MMKIKAEENLSFIFDLLKGAKGLNTDKIKLLRYI